MSNSTTSAATQSEFKSGWPVMSAAAVGIGLGMSPLPFYTLGPLAGPIMAEFNWTLGQVFLAFPVYTLTGVIMTPLAGMLADRFGARLVSLTSIILFGFAMMAQSLHTGSTVVYVLLWSLISIFGAGTLPITFTRAVSNAFDKHRGKALGVALIATGMFGTLAKYFAQEINATYGWREAYVALGFLPILIAFPLALLGMRDVNDTPARDANLSKYKIPILIPAFIGFTCLAGVALSFTLPQIAANGLKLEYVIVFPFIAITALPLLGYLFGNIRTNPIIREKVSSGIEQSGITLRQALTEWRLWLLCACFVPISYSIGAIIPNLEQVLAFKNFSVSDAVALAGLTGLAVLAGRIIGGVLIDKFWAPGVAFIFLATPGFAFYMLAAPDLSAESARIAIFMIGFGAGVEYDFLAFLVTKYFGMRNYSAIYGFIYVFFGIGAGFGPAIMAEVVTHGGGWDVALKSAGIIIALGSVPLLFLGKYRDFSPDRTQKMST